jgi:hypothetical protein
MRAFNRPEPRGEPDGERREDDVERDRERELDPREQYGVEVHSLILSLAAAGAAAYNTSELRVDALGAPQLDEL